MLYLGIFVRQFKKTVIIFEITALECLKFQNFMQNKKKSLNLVQKNGKTEIPYIWN